MLTSARAVSKRENPKIHLDPDVRRAVIETHRQMSVFGHRYWFQSGSVLVSALWSDAMPAGDAGTAAI